ncbi:MAG: hypothetical protein AB7M12_13205 [Hyphomonadaceae bacterium]
MRAWLRWAVAMTAALVTLFTIGRSLRERDDEPRVRQIGLNEARDANTIRPQTARALSLWSDGRCVECLAPALYSAHEARFGDVMRLASSRLPTLAPGGAAIVSVRKSAKLELARAA